MRRKRLVIVVLIILVPLVLAALFLCIERARGSFVLSRAERDLRAMGVKITAREFALPPAPGENGAPAIIAAAEKLSSLDLYPPKMRLLPSGHAIVGFREDTWFEDKQTNSWDKVAAEVATNSAALGEIAAGLKKPVLRNEMDFSLGANMPFKHLSTAKRPANWFAAAAQLELRRGNRKGALGYLVAGAEMPRLLAEDRLLISELVRIAVAAIARGATWEALQAEGWTDGELEQLQHSWEAQHWVSQMLEAIRGELVFTHEAFRDFRKSQENTVRSLFWMEEMDIAELVEGVPKKKTETWSVEKFFKKQVYTRIWRFAWLDQAEARTLRKTALLITALKEATETKSIAPIERVEAQLAALVSGRSVYGRLRFPSALEESTLGTGVKRAFRSETEAQMAVCAIALLRHKVQNGRFPENLQQLVPAILKQVPIDYMDGQPLKYRPDAGAGYVLYSCGNDGKDDKGDFAVRTGGTARNVWDRLDVPWPQPATADETAKYRRDEEAAAAKANR